AGDGHHPERHQHGGDRAGLPRDAVRRRGRVMCEVAHVSLDVGGGRSPERLSGDSVSPRGAFRAGGLTMMQPVVFDVKLFTGPGDLERSEVALLWMLEALCQV